MAIWAIWCGFQLPRKESHGGFGRAATRTRFAALIAISFVSMFLTQGVAGEAGNLRQLSPEELDEGWISLFDGETLYGWRNESDANWRVRDGVILADQGSKPGLLCTTSQFDSYRLSVDFWAAVGTNSGIFLRTSPRPQDPTSDCIELNIASRDVSPFPTGSLVGREATPLNFEEQTWHRMTVDVRPGSVVIRVDNDEVLTYSIDKPLGRGFLGLQFNQGLIKFCNVWLKPTENHPIFDGKTLDGWRLHPRLATKASVTSEGDLRLVGGRGQLETMSAYDDFVLQLQARTVVPQTNSGVFFRCIPTEEMMGYEVQIQNEILDGDATRPADCGTGGIFRRVNARRVNAQDGEWLHMTIIAVGPHISVWVGGLQVTDWHDEREPDLNPRRGLRKKAGTIMLQGHDPASEILFRQLTIPPHRKRQR